MDFLKYDETELVILLKQRDRFGFNYLYTSYSQPLYSIIKRIVIDEHIAEDVLQEVFVKIWSNSHQYDAAKGRLFTWMINIARNAAKDALRSRSHKMTQQTEPEHAIPNTTEQQTDVIGIKNMVMNMRPECKQIFELVYYNQYKITEVAATLRIPEGTVKTRLREGMKALRSAFFYSPPTPGNAVQFKAAYA